MKLYSMDFGTRTSKSTRALLPGQRCRANTYFDPIPDAAVENLDQIAAVTLFVAHNFDAVPFETLYANVAQDIFDKDLPSGHKGIVFAEILGPRQLEAEEKDQADHAHSLPSQRSF